jgi:hypothetical protein
MWTWKFCCCQGWHTGKMCSWSEPLCASVSYKSYHTSEEYLINFVFVHWFITKFIIHFRVHKMKHAQNKVPSYSFEAHRQESVFRFWTLWSPYSVWQLVLNISKKHNHLCCQVRTLALKYPSKTPISTSQTKWCPTQKTTSEYLPPLKPTNL